MNRSACGPSETPVAILLVVLLAAGPSAPDNARQIVEEAQRRTDAKSQRYQGLLQVFDAKGKVTDKRWTFERLGSHGDSRAVLRFTAPPDGAACWKIESTPKETKSSQYTRSIVWIRKDNYALARIENYVKTEVVRRLTYSDIQQVQGIWTGRTMEMADLRRGSRTRLSLGK